MRRARRVEGWVLDAGFSTPPYVPGWLLPAAVTQSPAIAPPGLPMHGGCVLTVDADADGLLRYFRQLPPLPPKRLQRDAAPWQCCELPVLLCVSGEVLVRLEMFGGAYPAASQFLRAIADTAAAPFEAYDDLDQHWAARVLVEEDDVWLREWDCDAADPLEGEVALRLPRAAVAAQARRAGERLERLHGLLVGAIGFDLWTTRPPEPRRS